MDWDWFEVEDSEVSPQQKVIVDIVRETARSWHECSPNSTAVLVFPWDEEDEYDRQRRTNAYDRYDAAIYHAIARRESVLKLIVDLVDLEQNLLLATLGATVAGNWLFCGQWHGQTYLPDPRTCIARQEACGPPEELGRIAAAWFDEIVRRPVIAPSRGRTPARFVGPGTPLPPDHVWIRNGPPTVRPKKTAARPAGGPGGIDDALSWIGTAAARQVELSLTHMLRASTEHRGPGRDSAGAHRTPPLFHLRPTAHCPLPVSHWMRMVARRIPGCRRGLRSSPRPRRGRPGRNGDGSPLRGGSPGRVGEQQPARWRTEA